MQVSQYFILLAWVSCTRVLALTRISETTQEVIINDLATTKRFLTLECNPSDFDIPRKYAVVGSDGITRNLTITCTLPQLLYSVERVGYVPRRGKVYTSEVCSTWNPNSYSSSADEVVDRSGIGRALLSARTQHSTETFGARGHDRRLLLFPFLEVGAALLVGAAVGVSVCATGILPISGCGSGGGGGSGVSQSDVDNLRDQQDKMLDTQDRFLGNLTSLQSSFTALAVSTEERFRGVADSFQWTRDGISQVRDLAVNNRANVELFRSEVTVDLNDVRSRVNQTSNAILQLARILQTQESDFTAGMKALAVQQINISSTFLSQIATLSGVMDSRDMLRVQNIQSLVRSVTKLFTTVARGFSRENTLAAINKLVQEQLTLLAADDYPMQPFVGDVGLPPIGDNLLGPELATILVETTRVRSVNKHPTELNKIRVNETDISLYCSTRFFVADPEVGRSYYQILSILGPNTTCSTQEGPTMCLCWFEVKNAYCDITVSTPGTNYADDTLRYTTNIFAFNQICANQGGTLVSSEPRIYIKSLPQFVNFTKNFCASSQPYLVSLSGGRTRAFDHVSIYFSVQRMGRSPGICSSRILETYNSAADDTIARMLLMTAEAYKWKGTINEVLKRKVVGVLPNDLTLEEAPAVMINGTNIGPCWYSYMMGYSQPNDWLPVYEITPSEKIAPITVEIQDTTGTTTQEYQYSTLILPDAELIPARFTVIGSPLGEIRLDDTFTSVREIYNIREAELSTANIPALREGQAAYAIVYGENVPLQERNITTWKRQNGGFRFNHLAGLNTPWLSRHVIDDETGLCDDSFQSPLGSGSWCERRLRFGLDFEYSTFSKLFVMYPNTARVQMQVEIPEGVVVTSLRSACPDVRFTKSDIGSISVVLTNPLSVPNDVRLIRDSPTAACRRQEPFTLPGRGTITVNYGICVLGNLTLVNNTDTIRVQVLVDGTRTQICPVNISLAVQPRGSRLAVDESYINIRRVEVANINAYTTLRAMQGLSTLMGDMILDNARAFVATGVPISEVTLSGTAQRLAALNATIASITRNLYTEYDSVVNYTQTGVVFTREFDNVSTALNVSLTKLTDELKNLRQQNDAAAVILERVISINASLEGLRLDYQRSTKELLDTQADILQKQVDAGNKSCSGFFKSFICFLEDMLKIVVIVTVLGLIGYAIYAIVKRCSNSNQVATTSGAKRRRTTTKKNAKYVEVEVP